ncbi:hypothetical protein JCM11641_007393 [Rhodosporidiobolus odoratus]
MSAAQAQAQAQAMAAFMQQAVNSVVAPMVVATSLSCILFGLVCSLVLTYFNRFPNDRIGFKLLVAAFGLIAALDTAVSCSWCYKVAVDAFSNPMVLGLLPWQLTCFAFLTGTVVLVCQLFFAWRVWVISGRKSYVLSVIQLCIILGAAGLVYYMGSYSAKTKYLAAFADIQGVLHGWIAACLAVDLLITGSLAYYLILRPRKVTGTGLRSSALTRIVVRAFETNLVSLILQCVLVGLTVYSVHRGSLHYLIMAFLETKTYIACVIITLNSRRQERKDGATHDSGNQSSRGFESRPFPASSATNSLTPGNSVHVQIARNVSVDDEVDGIEICEEDSGRRSGQYNLDIVDELGDVEKKAGSH